MSSPINMNYVLVIFLTFFEFWTVFLAVVKNPRHKKVVSVNDG